MVVLLVARSAPADVIVFQDGVSPTAGYDGTLDTYLDSGFPTSTRHTADPILLDSSPDYGVLIKFDVSQIPATSVVISATLEVNVTAGSFDTYEAFEMLRDWVPAETTWNEWSIGSSWTTAGAQGIGTDRGGTSLGSLSGGTGARTLTFNASGISVVQQWVSAPASNLGIAIQDYDAPFSDGLDFSAEDAITAANRPKLTVTYRPRRVMVID